MGTKEKETRKKFIKIRVNTQERQQINRQKALSAERTLSDYLRKLALQKPVVVTHRNESLDQLLQRLIDIKNELNALGNNFNQAVHKLHTLDRIPEFRQWLNSYEESRHLLLQKMEETKLKMNQLYEQWLPRS